MDWLLEPARQSGRPFISKQPMKMGVVNAEEKWVKKGNKGY
jgi:hypothetical protein